MAEENKTNVREENEFVRRNLTHGRKSAKATERAYDLTANFFHYFNNLLRNIPKMVYECGYNGVTNKQKIPLKFLFARNLKRGFARSALWLNSQTAVGNESVSSLRRTGEANGSWRQNVRGNL